MISNDHGPVSGGLPSIAQCIDHAVALLLQAEMCDDIERMERLDSMADTWLNVAIVLDDHAEAVR